MSSYEGPAFFKIVLEPVPERFPVYTIIGEAVYPLRQKTLKTVPQPKGTLPGSPHKELPPQPLPQFIDA